MSVALPGDGMRPADPVTAGSGDVTNSGTIAAAQAKLDAVGGNVYALATNNGGIIRATGTTTKGGHVYLSAGGGYPDRWYHMRHKNADGPAAA